MTYELPPVLYEDEWLVFVDKPAGLLVQQSPEGDEPHLHDLMSMRAVERGERAFLLQRLDRGTSGVIFFTKRSEINSKINRAFEQKAISKRYLALVEGTLSVPQLIDAPITRIGAITFGVRRDGRRALTRVLPRSASAETSLLEIELLTGRTHQIRVHLSSILHPLVGDWLYGREVEGKRPMLHAWGVTMTHPHTGERLEITAPIPVDFREEMESSGLHLRSPDPTEE
jgi:23S rRNA pseudouridine1911/1915/1917 synthase